MDKFIVQENCHKHYQYSHLKSNMDKFIEITNYYGFF